MEILCALGGYDDNNIANSCITSTIALPSELDLNAITYMYGTDGFRVPNVILEPNSHYPPNLD